jgi:hypothetical protein
LFLFLKLEDIRACQRTRYTLEAILALFTTQLLEINVGDLKTLSKYD